MGGLREHFAVCGSLGLEFCVFAFAQVGEFLFDACICGHQVGGFPEVGFGALVVFGGCVAESSSEVSLCKVGFGLDGIFRGVGRVMVPGWFARGEGLDYGAGLGNGQFGLRRGEFECGERGVELNRDF